MKVLATASVVLLLAALAQGGEATKAGEASAEEKMRIEVEGMLAALEGEGSRLEKLSVAQKLGRLDDSATGMLVEGYRSASKEARGYIARALPQHGGEEVEGLVIEEVQRGGGCPDGMIAAAGKLRVTKAVPALLAQYGEEEDGKRHGVILSALSQIADARALGVLAEASVSEERLSRLTGVSGLQRLAGEAGEGELTEEDTLALYGCLMGLVNGEETPHLTRLGAITAMGMTRDAKLARQIAPLVGSIARDTQLRAIEALGRMRATEEAWRLVEALESSEASVRIAAIEGLEKMGEKSCAGELVVLMEDPDKLVRKRALAAVRKLTGQTLSGNPEHWRRWLESDENQTEEEESMTIMKVAKE